MKITRLKEVRIIVEPDFGFAPSEHWDRMAQNTLEQIKRHIDFENAYIQQTTEAICSHCGLTWEEDADGPVCCSKAQDEWEAAREPDYKKNKHPFVGGYEIDPSRPADCQLCERRRHDPIHE